jgi:hypothetical protein
MGVQEEQAAFYAGVQWADDQCPVHGYPELVRGEAAKRYPVEETVTVPVEVHRNWRYELTHEEREGLYRDSLLEAAQHDVELSALLWGVSPQPVWSTAGLQMDFKVIAFQAPYVSVERRSDGVQGSLRFTDRPRFYFGWAPHPDPVGA